MATSLESLQNNNGILQPTPVQDLAAQQGLVSAPTTAATTAMIGGTPNQQQMAGTPAQMTAAIQAVARPEDTLAYAERVDTGRTTSGGEEARKLPDALKQLMGVGGKIGAAVGDAIKGQIQEISAFQVNPEEISKYSADKQPAITSAAERFVAALQGEKPEDRVTRLQELQAAMGLDPKSSNSLAEVSSLFGVDPKNFIATIQDNPVFDVVTFGQMATATSGIDEGAILSAMNQVLPLDATPLTLDSLRKMSWGEVKGRVKNMMRERYADVEELSRQANDPTLPINIQKAAQARLRQLGVAGVIAEADEAKTLAQRIEDGDNITFQGESIEIEELLNNDFIAEKLTGIFTANPDEAAGILNSLKGTPLEPLIDLVKTYSADLAKYFGLEGNTSALMQVFAERDANAAAVTSSLNNMGIAEGTTLSPTVKTLLGITPETEAGTAPVTSTEYSDYLQGLEAGQQNVLAAALSDPSFPPSQIESLLKTMKTMTFKDSTEMQTYVNNFKEGALLFGGLLGADKNKDGVLDQEESSSFMKGIQDLLGVSSDDLTANLQSEFGFDLPEWLDKDNDGKLDDANTINKNIAAISPEQFASSLIADDAITQLSSAITTRNSELANIPATSATEQQAAAYSPGHNFPNTAVAAFAANAYRGGFNPNNLTGGIEYANMIATKLAGTLKSISDEIDKLNGLRAGSKSPAAQRAYDARIASLRERMNLIESDRRVAVDRAQNLAARKKAMKDIQANFQLFSSPWTKNKKVAKLLKKMMTDAAYFEKVWNGYGQNFSNIFGDKSRIKHLLAAG